MLTLHPTTLFFSRTVTCLWKSGLVRMFLMISICSIAFWFASVRCDLMRVFPWLLENCKTQKVSTVSEQTVKMYLFLLSNTCLVVSHLSTGRIQLFHLHLSEGDHKINSGIFHLPCLFTLCIRECSVNYSSTFSLEQSVRRFTCARDPFKGYSVPGERSML